MQHIQHDSHENFCGGSSKRLKVKRKPIPVTGRGGLCSCETLKIPHFPDNWLTDGDEIASLSLRPRFTPQDDSWYSILLEAESTLRL
jgi:hypothetical protein